MQKIDAEVFWQWAYSDFLSNASRGVLAEYIVAKALECELTHRSQWEDFDLLAPCGMKVEVKSAAYVQSWHQERPSQIRFDIAERKGKRCADVYVFCLLKTKQRPVNPLDPDEWEFYPCCTSLLNEAFPGQKTVGLPSLARAGLHPLGIGALKAGVAALANNSFKPTPLRGAA